MSLDKLISLKNHSRFDSGDSDSDDSDISSQYRRTFDPHARKSYRSSGTDPIDAEAGIAFSDLTPKHKVHTVHILGSLSPYVFQDDEAKVILI